MALTGEPTGQECHHQWIIQPAEGPVSEGICHNCHEVRTFANNLERHDRLNDGSQSPSAPIVGAGRKRAADNGPGVFRILNSVVSFILTLVLVVVILLMVPVVLIATGILGIRQRSRTLWTGLAMVLWWRMLNSSEDLSLILSQLQHRRA